MKHSKKVLVVVLLAAALLLAAPGDSLSAPLSPLNTPTAAPTAEPVVEPTSAPEDPVALPPAPGDDDTLKFWLLFLFAGPGAGLTVFAFMRKSAWVNSLSSEHKRYFSLLSTATLASAAFVVAVLLGYSDAPASAQGWLERVFDIAFAAIGIAQLAHGRIDLGKKKEPEAGAPGPDNGRSRR